MRGVSMCPCLFIMSGKEAEGHLWVVTRICHHGGDSVDCGARPHGVVT